LQYKLKPKQELIDSEKAKGLIVPLKHPPYPGQFLFCDYRGFVAPEMIKMRPAIAISPRDRAGYNLVHVVPLSTTKPDFIRSHHILITMPRELVGITAHGITIAEECWIKCDLVNTVSFQRLEAIPIGKTPAGKRIYSNQKVKPDILVKIRQEVARKMGINIDAAM
jgi:uncharacterized protein YifN (PemK superfamily)